MQHTQVKSTWMNPQNKGQECMAGLLSLRHDCLRIWFYIYLEAAADLLPWVECIDHRFLKIVTVAGLFCCHEVLSTARYSREICIINYYKEVTGGTWGEQPKLELVSCVFPQKVNSQTHYYSPLLNSCERLTNKSWDVSNTLLLLSQPAHVRTSILC